MSSPVCQVVTIREAALMYYRSEGAVRYHLDRGNLIWRKTSHCEKGIILIDLASLKSLWGTPQNFDNLVATK